MANETDQRTAVNITVLSSLMLGSSYVAVKIGVGEVDPFFFGAVAMGVGSLLLLIIMAYRGTLTRAMLRRWEFWVAPVVNTGVVGFQYVGLTMTKASAAGLIIGTNVLFVTILSYLFYKERLTPIRIFGLFLGFLGLTTITTKWDLATLEGSALIGNLLILASAVCIAIVVMMSKKAMENLSSEQWTLSLHMFLPLTLGTLGFLIPSSQGIGGDAWLVAIYVGLVCSTVPTVLWTKALPKLGVVTLSTILMLESTFAVLLSVIILNESLDVFVVGGALMTIIAIFFVASNND